MAELIYDAITSLDGYLADADGNFDWAEPDDEVHAFVNDLARPTGTFLYGRTMYEMMTGWENDPGLAEHSPLMADFAGIWQAADKVVYSTTLAEPSTGRTRIERSFDPEAVRSMKAAATRDLGIGGANLAAHVIRAGLVDEYHLFLNPMIVGGGLRALPDDVRLDLQLVEERRFAGGVVFLRYRPR